MLLTKSLVKWFMQACMLSLLTIISPVDVSLAQSPPAATEAGPDLAAQQFYKWYLRLLAENKDPMHDEAAMFSNYVSGALVKDIEKKIHSPDGMESDYFIQAQDYLDDWPGNVSVATPRIERATAKVTVSLGAAKSSAYRLAVTLVKEKSTWKIRKVARLGS
jgi:hypothetical protein